MEISKRYDPTEVEQKWYEYWMEKGYFHSDPDEREKFTIVMPPPNVTGVLHMGHMLNHTIQDVLTRNARQEGKNACWVPGTDHASIATEAKVVKMLREKGIKKADLSREEFMEYAFQWKGKYGGIILDQLKKLGTSCDWEREAFTMDEKRSKAVIKAFVDLYHKGFLYRDYRMVSWDPIAHTVLSNEEVIHSDENGKLYHVTYKLDGSDESITIATTRPETILADTAIAVNPEDKRYEDMIGKDVLVPLTGRIVPIIADAYVDMEFGSGALKITPAHDINDYNIGKKHDLDVIEILTADATMKREAGKYEGMDRMEARKMIAKDLDEIGLLEKIEDYRHSVGRSERSNAIVEPRLSLQWFVDMKKLAEPALEVVKNSSVKFYPENQVNTYNHWMENIQDWCVSRQLWWGHRIPVWYYGEKEYVAETAEEALYQVKAFTGNEDLTVDDLRQDEDVLDTWFSSWLWPISVFDGFEDTSEMHYYYPTDVVVTAPDIIFLWIARMIMAGMEWTDQWPFHAVYFTGLVRDNQRRKMSKSLGNSPDAMQLIENYGADSVRFGMLFSSPAGGDLLYDEKHIIQGRNFCNKLWNSFRFIVGIEVDGDLDTPMLSGLAVNWINDSFARLLQDINHDYQQYRISDILKKLYRFIRDDFSGWYLEMVKPAYGEKMDNWTHRETIKLYENIMVMLHPFMPFITEEIYHLLDKRTPGDDIIIAGRPETEGYNEEFLKDISQIQSLISKIRELRSAHDIPFKDLLELQVQKSETSRALFEPEGRKEFLESMAIVKLSFTDSANEEGIAFVEGTSNYFLIIPEGVLDVEEQISKLNDRITYTKGFIASIEKKLSNEQFVNNAPETIVAKERKKHEDGLQRLKKLEENLERLGS